MTEDQSTIADGQSNKTCSFCGDSNKVRYKSVCFECIQQTLLKHLPRLKRVLEDKCGEMLDNWLTAGRLKDVKWEADEEFKPSVSLVKNLLKDTIKEAVEKGTISLYLDKGTYWRPLRTEELMEHVLKHCVDDLQQLIRESIIKAISTAPTLETEREIIEVASGKRRCRKRYLREEAVSAVAYSKALSLVWPISVLVELRYRRDKGMCTYVEVLEPRIDVVWQKVEEFLPEEIVKLIDRDV